MKGRFHELPMEGRAVPGPEREPCARELAAPWHLSPPVPPRARLSFSPPDTSALGPPRTNRKRTRHQAGILAEQRLTRDQSGASTQGRLLDGMQLRQSGALSSAG